MPIATHLAVAIFSVHKNKNKLVVNHRKKKKNSKCQSRNTKRESTKSRATPVLIYFTLMSQLINE